jgi:hypothetical protein
VLEFAILGLLQPVAPIAGYELRKQLGDAARGLLSISYGSLNPPRKRRRHAAGLVTTDEPDRAARCLPADARRSTGRRGQGSSTRSPRGQGALPRAGQPDRPEAYDDGGFFGVRLAFFRHTAADVRLRILEGRAAPSSGSARACGPR